MEFVYLHLPAGLCEVNLLKLIRLRQPALLQALIRWAGRRVMTDKLEGLGLIQTAQSYYPPALIYIIYTTRCFLTRRGLTSNSCYVVGVKKQWSLCIVVQQCLSWLVCFQHTRFVQECKDGEPEVLFVGDSMVQLMQQYEVRACVRIFVERCFHSSYLSILPPKNVLTLILFI